MNGNGTHDAPETPPRAMQEYQEMGRTHPKKRGQKEYRRPKMAIKRKSPKRGPHTASDKDIEKIKEQLAMRDALGEYKWLLAARLDFSQSWIVEEKQKDKRKYDRLRRLVTAHDRTRRPGGAYPDQDYKTTPQSGHLRKKRFGRPNEQRKGRIEGSKWEGILRTLRREIPINHRRICAQYRVKQSTKTIIQEHLMRRTAHWKNTKLRRTVIKNLLTHRMKQTKTKVAPPLVVISLLLYQWGSVESIHVTPNQTGNHWGHARFGGVKNHGKHWQIVMVPWTVPPWRNTEERSRDGGRLLEKAPWMVPPWHNPALSDRGYKNLTVKEPWMVPPWRYTTMREQGSNNLTERVPWLVPPWGHHEIEKHGKDDLTEKAPWMVPPWRWKTRRNEVEEDYRPGDEQPALQRWLVRIWR